MSKFIRKDVPLCACGCGERTKWNKGIKKRPNFIRGHHMRGQHNPNLGKDKYKSEREKQPPLCKCGCGSYTKWDKDCGTWGDFIRGHNTRVRKIKFILSKEAIQKMANSLKGRKLSKKTRERMSIAQKGRIFSKETRTKLSIANTGHKTSEETKKKLSIINSGPGNPHWRGGIAAEPYCDIWLDQDYKNSIKERDNYKCQNPNCKNNCGHLPLHIHHIDYNKKHCHPWDLITLCASCNSKANTNRFLHTAFYQKIMMEKYGYCYG